MARYEPMDLEGIDSDFDDKENSLRHSNVLPMIPCVEKGYEELDLSELNMKLRYSITPTSPLSKSLTSHCLDKRSFNNDDSICSVEPNENESETQSLNSTITRSDISRSLKSLPLQVFSNSRTNETKNTSVLCLLDSKSNEANGIIMLSGVTENEENASLASTSSSVTQTPEATTPIKEIPKHDGGSPILRGLKNVLNMFRSSQSPVPEPENKNTFEPELSPVDAVVMHAENVKVLPILASTPITSKHREGSVSKGTSPLKESLCFKDDLERELQWKDETTILFKEEKIPFHKLFPTHCLPSGSRKADCMGQASISEQNTNLNASLDYMDISNNDTTNGTLTVESDGEFVDCETTVNDDIHYIKEDSDSLSNITIQGNEQTHHNTPDSHRQHIQNKETITDSAPLSEDKTNIKNSNLSQTVQEVLDIPGEYVRVIVNDSTVIKSCIQNDDNAESVNVKKVLAPENNLVEPPQNVNESFCLNSTFVNSDNDMQNICENKQFNKFRETDCLKLDTRNSDVAVSRDVIKLCGNLITNCDESISPNDIPLPDEDDVEHYSGSEKLQVASKVSGVTAESLCEKQNIVEIDYCKLASIETCSKITENETNLLQNCNLIRNLISDSKDDVPKNRQMISTLKLMEQKQEVLNESNTIDSTKSEKETVECNDQQKCVSIDQTELLLEEPSPYCKDVQVDSSLTDDYKTMLDKLECQEGEEVDQITFLNNPQDVSLSSDVHNKGNELLSRDKADLSSSNFGCSLQNNCKNILNSSLQFTETAKNHLNSQVPDDVINKKNDTMFEKQLPIVKLPDYSSFSNVPSESNAESEAASARNESFNTSVERDDGHENVLSSNKVENVANASVYLTSEPEFHTRHFEQNNLPVHTQARSDLHTSHERLDENKTGNYVHVNVCAGSINHLDFITQPQKESEPLSINDGTPASLVKEIQNTVLDNCVEQISPSVNEEIGMIKDNIEDLEVTLTDKKIRVSLLLNNHLNAEEDLRNDNEFVNSKTSSSSSPTVCPSEYNLNFDEIDDALLAKSQFQNVDSEKYKEDITQLISNDYVEQINASVNTETNQAGDNMKLSEGIREETFVCPPLDNYVTQKEVRTDLENAHPSMTMDSDPLPLLSPIITTEGNHLNFEKKDDKPFATKCDLQNVDSARNEEDVTHVNTILKDCKEEITINGTDLITDNIKTFTDIIHVEEDVCISPTDINIHLKEGKENFDNLERPIIKEFDTSPESSSPQISPKGYNFNFNDIEDPLATKTKIRMSPPPNDATTSLSYNEEGNDNSRPLDRQKDVRNQKLQCEQEKQKTCACKAKSSTSGLNNRSLRNKEEINCYLNDTFNVPVLIGKSVNNDTLIEPIEVFDYQTETIAQNVEDIKTVAKDFDVELDKECSDTLLNDHEDKFFTTESTQDTANSRYKNVFNIPEMSSVFISKSNGCPSPPLVLEEGKATENHDTNMSTVDVPSSKSSDGAIGSEVNTEDEDTVAFFEPEEFDNVDDVSDHDDMINFADVSAQGINSNVDNGEMFIDAEAFDFLLNQNKSNAVTDSGKESLFLKFDPLFAHRMSTGGALAPLNKVKKRQSTPKKILPSSSNCNVTAEVHNILETSFEDPNVSVSKPVMVVNPAFNSYVSPRTKCCTPPGTNRRSLTFTSPAIAVIDRLLSLSGTNSPLKDEITNIQGNRQSNEADLALTQLRELLAEKEIHAQNLRTESAELRNRLCTLEFQVQKLESENEQKLRKINELNERLAEKTKINKSMTAVLEEYERTMASLIAEIGQDKRRHAEERTRLKSERNEQTAHLASMELAFNDLHSKYEKSKQIIMSCKANEETYKRSMKEFEENLLKMQNNYELLKQHASSQLSHANKEFKRLNRAHEAEVLKLNAMIKRKEVDITSLEETLAQKIKTNDELAAICEDLINKVG